MFNVPGLGKNYLRAAQHHDVIAILPNGRRAYEFHPWEKKLALADTYVYTDVAIHDYLERLKRLGESAGDYRSIWYYYGGDPGPHPLDLRPTLVVACVMGTRPPGGAR